MRVFLLLVAPYDVNIIGNDMYSQGDQLMLNCLSEGGPQSRFQYSWTFSRSDSEIADTQTLTIDNVNPFHGGTYTCTVTIGGFPATSASSNLTVYSEFSHTIVVAQVNMHIPLMFY